MTKRKAKKVSKKATLESSAKSSGPLVDAKGRKMVPQPHGGALIPGAGGGPQPGAGRPPDQWKAALRALADRKEVLDHIDTALQAGPSDPFFAKALDYVTEHGYGKATQPVAHSGSLGIVDLLESAHAATEPK